MVLQVISWTQYEAMGRNEQHRVSTDSVEPHYPTPYDPLLDGGLSTGCLSLPQPSSFSRPQNRPQSAAHNAKTSSQTAAFASTMLDKYKYRNLPGYTGYSPGSKFVAMSRTPFTNQVELLWHPNTLFLARCQQWPCSCLETCIHAQHLPSATGAISCSIIYRFWKCRMAAARCAYLKRILCCLWQALAHRNVYNDIVDRNGRKSTVFGFNTNPRPLPEPKSRFVLPNLHPGDHDHVTCLPPRITGNPSNKHSFMLGDPRIPGTYSNRTAHRERFRGPRPGKLLHEHSLAELFSSPAARISAYEKAICRVGKFRVRTSVSSLRCKPNQSIMHTCVQECCGICADYVSFRI